MKRGCCRVGLSLGILAWGTWALGAGKPESPMPPAAAAIITQMDKEILAAKLKSIGSLEKVLKDTTKKGDLAGAMAVKEAIDQLKKEAQVSSRPGAGRGSGSMIVGPWQGSTMSMEFFLDGTAKASNGWSGTWLVDGKTVNVTWDSRYSHRLDILAEGLVGTRLSPSGREEEVVRFTRAK